MRRFSSADGKRRRVVLVEIKNWPRHNALLAIVRKTHREFAMNRLDPPGALVVLFLALAAPSSVCAQTLPPHQQLARDIYQELVEINTVTATGDTARAAEAMAARLMAAGFSGRDVQISRPRRARATWWRGCAGTGRANPCCCLRISM